MQLQQKETSEFLFEFEFTNEHFERMRQLELNKKLEKQGSKANNCDSATDAEPVVMLHDNFPRFKITFRSIEDDLSTETENGHSMFQEYVQELWLWNTTTNVYDKIVSEKYNFALRRITVKKSKPPAKGNANKFRNPVAEALKGTSTEPEMIPVTFTAFFSKENGFNVNEKGNMYFTWIDEHNVQESLLHKLQTLHCTFDYTYLTDVVEYNKKYKEYGVTSSEADNGRKHPVTFTCSDISVQQCIQLNRYNTSKCGLYSTDSFEYSISILNEKKQDADANENTNVVVEERISQDEYWLIKEKLQECYDKFMQLSYEKFDGQFRVESKAEK